jgi:hypothetical protein
MCSPIRKTALCQAWYARRTFRLYKSHLLVGVPLYALVLTSLGLGLAMVGKLVHIIGGSIAGASGLNQVNSTVVQKMLIPRYYYLMCCILDVFLTAGLIGKLLSLKRGFNPRCAVCPLL